MQNYFTTNYNQKNVCNNRWAIRSGGLKSGGPIFGGLKSGGLMSGGLKSAHRRIECRSYRDVVANSILPAQCVRFKKNVDTKILINPIDFCTRR